jgi:TPP-dependent indolepyruvate ferredoxin oxidoreductase alpha subunit
MRDEEYHRQIEEGQNLIEEQIRARAEKHGISIEKIEWSEKKLSSNGYGYTVTIKTNTKQNQYSFTQEQLADLPSRIKVDDFLAQTVNIIIKELKDP